jgi:hypothetical protein
MRNDPKSGESVMDGVRRGNFQAQWGKVPEGKVGAADFGVQADSQVKPGMFQRPTPSSLLKDPRPIE